MGGEQSKDCGNGVLTGSPKVFGRSFRGFKAHGVRNFYKQCQEVSTVAQQILLGAPNTIKENIIKQTLDEEPKLIEQKLLLENKIEYKLPQGHQSKWLNYAVV
jgi:hypothetical protein